MGVCLERVVVKVIKLDTQPESLIACKSSSNMIGCEYRYIPLSQKVHEDKKLHSTLFMTPK